MPSSSEEEPNKANSLGGEVNLSFYIYIYIYIYIYRYIYIYILIILPFHFNTLATGEK
jgi:hypothetical protein